jgi:hypothetical protein
MTKKWLVMGLVFIIFGFILLKNVEAHQSGCHRWHSCPSDTGSYTCGDAGYPCQYPTYPADGGVIYPPSGYYKDCYDCALKKVPDNSYTNGIGWSCDTGYKKVGNACQKIVAPNNSYFIGSTWYCDYGYKKVGNKCVR